MAIEIQLKRGVAANWTSLNPILAQGEIGYETNTNKFKIGDGATAWSGLSYFASGSGLSTTAWETSTTYIEDSIVGYGGKIYISLQNNNLGKDPVTEPTWWEEFAGGVSKLTASITIAVADWSGGTTCTKSVAGVTATTWNDFAVAEAYRDKVIEFDVRPSGQGAGTITFTADSTPDVGIVFTVKIQEV